MKTITTILLSVITLMLSPIAQAKDMPLLRLTCETCKGVEIPIGLIVADQNPRQIQGVYFIDDDGSRKTFSIEQLKQLTLVYEFKGYEAAFVTLTTNTTAGTAQLYLKFLRNAIRGTYGETSFSVRYNASMNMYQVINPKGERPISQAYITPNKFLGKMIGIYHIDMR